MFKMVKAVSPVNFENALIYSEPFRWNLAQLQVTKHYLPKNKQKHISQYIKNICTGNAPHNFIITSHGGNFASQ